MDFNNKTILIVGLVCGGLFSLYLHNEQLASVIFGGLIGYLSKDTIKVETDGASNNVVDEPFEPTVTDEPSINDVEDSLEDGSDSDIA